MEAANVEVSVDEQAKMLMCCICDGILCDPMQLSCLHNCCRECIKRDVTDAEQRPSIECPQCKDITAVDCASRNDFLAARVLAFKVLTGAVHCNLCTEDGKEDAQADSWCHDCQRAFCSDCTAGHHRYNRSHDVTMLESPEGSLPDRSLVLTSLCKPHGQRAELVCMTCRSVACLTCARECMDTGHDLKHTASERLDQLMQVVTAGIAEGQHLLSGVSKFASSQDSFIRSLEEARQSSIDLLRLNKKQILDCVTKAVAGAEEALNDGYDQLLAKALDMARAAEALGPKSDCAINYARCLLGSKDVSGLFSQQHALLSRIQALLEDLDRLVCNADRGSRVVVDGGIPVNMDEVIKKWIGIPRSVTSWPNDGVAASGPATTPVMFGEGDKVSLRCTDDELVELQEELSPCLAEIRKCRGKVGVVQQVRGVKAVVVFYQHIGRTFLLNPRALHKVISVGDTVTVTSSIDLLKAHQSAAAAQAMGRRLKVVTVLENGKIKVTDGVGYLTIDQACCTVSK